MTLYIVGLLGSEEEADEIKFVSKVFLISVRIHELVAKQKKVKK